MYLQHMCINNEDTGVIIPDILLLEKQIVGLQDHHQRDLVAPGLCLQGWASEGTYFAKVIPTKGAYLYAQDPPHENGKGFIDDKDRKI